MLTIQQQVALVLILSSVPRASAQYYNGYDSSGNSYAERIGIGVGVALVIALIVLFIGYIMRRRRARAFKQAYANQGQFGQQQGGAVQLEQQPPYIPGYQQQPSFQEAPAYTNYRPDASNYNNSYQGQQPNGQAPSYYPPPSSPPPQQEQPAPTHYAPPPGPPPQAYDPTNAPQK